MRRARISGYSAKVAAVKYHTSTSYQQLKSQITCEQVPHDVISPHHRQLWDHKSKVNSKKSRGAMLHAWWETTLVYSHKGPASIDLRCARETLAEVHIKVLQRLTKSHQRPGRIPQTTDNSRPMMNFTPLWSGTPKNRLSDQVTRRQTFLWLITLKNAGGPK